MFPGLSCQTGLSQDFPRHLKIFDLSLSLYAQVHRTYTAHSLLYSAKINSPLGYLNAENPNHIPLVANDGELFLEVLDLGHNVT